MAHLGPSMQVGKEASPQSGLPKKRLEKGCFEKLNMFSYCGCSCWLKHEQLFVGGGTRVP